MSSYKYRLLHNNEDKNKTITFAHTLTLCMLTCFQITAVPSVLYRNQHRLVLSGNLQRQDNAMTQAIITTTHSCQVALDWNKMRSLPIRNGPLHETFYHNYVYFLYATPDPNSHPPISPLKKNVNRH